MKKTILTLAAVLALSGSAFAASATQPVKQAPAAATRTYITGSALRIPAYRQRA